MIILKFIIYIYVLRFNKENLKSFASSGFLFKDDPPISSFKLWNNRLRNIIEIENDWDKELDLLSEINRVQETDEAMCNEDAINQELDFSESF